MASLCPCGVARARQCKAQGLKMEAIQEITGLSKAGRKVAATPM